MIVPSYSVLLNVNMKSNYELYMVFSILMLTDSSKYIVNTFVENISNNFENI